MLDLDIISSELRAGRPILVFDQKDREGETDIFFSAKYYSNSSFKINVFYNPVNQGYGGNQKIEEISIPTFYGDEICHVNGMKYAFNVIFVTLIAKLQKITGFNFTNKFKESSLNKKSQNIKVDKLLELAKKRR